MSGDTFRPRGAATRVRPALLAVLILAQALSNAVVPGLGLAFLLLLLWRPAKRSRAFVAMLTVVATLSAVLLASVIADFVGGPTVGYSFG